MRPAPRTRGSLISSRESTSPMTPRTSAETRSTRTDISAPPVVEVGSLQIFGAEALQLALFLGHVGVIAEKAQQLVERRLGEAPIVPHHRQPEAGPLPQVVVAHLGDRGVELSTHQIFQTTENHALFLERV